jgi:integrase
MPTLTLTARKVDSIRPTPGKRTEYFDRGVPGLALRVTENGAKSWTVLYRHRARLRRLTLGSASVLSLADARERARDELYAAGKGADPAATKRQARTAQTIADLATDYIEIYAKKRKRSWKEDDRILRAEVLPRWKHRAIADIKRRDVRTLVEAIAARGAGIMANRTTALLSKLFRFALDREYIDASPAAHITRPTPETKRDRVLTDDEIRSVWQSFDVLDAPMAAFYKLRLLTAQRGGEVGSMRWQDLDLAGGWWTIPAGFSKNKLAHRVPLAASVVKLIQTLKPEPDAKHQPLYVLEGARGKRQQSEAAATFTVGDFRGHDLRRTAASIMASGGIPRLVIGKILNHVEPGITAVYDRHSYDAEKRKALDWWARKLAAIVDGKSAKILSFGR